MFHRLSHGQKFDDSQALVVIVVWSSVLMSWTPFVMTYSDVETFMRGTPSDVIAYWSEFVLDDVFPAMSNTADALQTLQGFAGDTQSHSAHEDNELIILHQKVTPDVTGLDELSSIIFRFSSVISDCFFRLSKDEVRKDEGFCLR